MFLQTSSFSFHTRAAPIVFLTVVCQAAEQKLRTLETVI